MNYKRMKPTKLRQDLINCGLPPARAEGIICYMLDKGIVWLDRDMCFAYGQAKEKPEDVAQQSQPQKTAEI